MPPPRSFAHRLEAFGNAPALVLESGETISYSDLAKQADAFASQLGTSRRLLLLEARNEPEAVVAYLGALRAGHPIIMAPPGSVEQANSIVTTFEPELVYRRESEDWKISSYAKTPPESLHEDLGVMLSTSGTTGSAKLVRLTLANVQANADSIAEYLQLSSTERPITSLPIHYSYGLSVLNSHLTVGAAVVLTELSASEEAFWDLLKKENVTSIAGVPYTYELFERIGFRSRDLPSLRCMTQAGGRLSAELVKTYAQWSRAKSIRFFVMYGQTEATARIAYLPPHLTEEHSDCIGVPIPGGKLEIEDINGATIEAHNVVGELIYTGPNVMMGYATAREHLGLGRELTSLRTGDLAMRTEAGLFKITGRTSRFSKLFGLRIGFDEIEKELRKHNLESYVNGNDQLIAICSPTPNSSEKALTLLTDRYQLPESCFEVCDGAPPPLLASGKIDYRTILAKAQEARNARHAATTSEDIQSRVLAAFRPIRSRQPARPSDSFLSLGGDSLNFVEVSLALERILGFVPKGWEKMTIAELGSLDNQKARRHVTVPVDVLIRAAAIFGVVTTHASNVHIGGGAFLLFAVSGFNFARFQAAHLTAGRLVPVLRMFAVNILLPYYALLLAYFAYKGTASASSLLLVSNLFGRFSSLLEPYWYIESLAQVVLLTCIAFSLPTVRHLTKHHPWKTALAFVILAASARLLLPDLSAFPRYAWRLPHNMFVLFALGWSLYFAHTVRERVAFSVVLLATAALFYSNAASHFLWLVAGALSIAWLPSITLPRMLGTVISTIGGCSYYIYLTHMVVVAPALQYLPEFALVLSLIATPLLGLFARWAGQNAIDKLQALFAKQPPTDAPRGL